MHELYLLRHAQTACSARGNLCGRACDVPLNDTGRAMAQAMAQGLTNLCVDVIVTSPQRRAKETAAPLAERLGLVPEEIYELSELHYGAWEGLSPEEIGAREPEALMAWLKEPAGLSPPGGETVRALAERINAGLSTLHARYPKGRVLVVSHKTTLRVLTAVLLGVDVRDYRRRFAMPLGALTAFDFKGEGPQLKRFADASHLPPHLRNLAGS